MLNRKKIEKNPLAELPEKEELAWFAIAALIVLFYLLQIIFGAPFKILFTEYYWGLIVLGLCILIPVLFKLIFGLLPYQLLIHSFRKRENEFLKKNNPNKKEEYYNDENALEYLETLAEESNQLANKIFSRAGAFLLAGILIAIGGVVYFNIVQTVFFNNDWVQVVSNLAPRFGGLFFIEFIAFFFLKQYRILMDEFRYYESLKRQRESNLIIMKYRFYNDEEFDKVIAHLKLFEVPDKLGKDESTSLIESRKYTNEELQILQNIINGVLKGKK